MCVAKNFGLTFSAWPHESRGWRTDRRGDAAHRLYLSPRLPRPAGIRRIRAPLHLRERGRHGAQLARQVFRSLRQSVEFRRGGGLMRFLWLVIRLRSISRARWVLDYEREERKHWR